MAVLLVIGMLLTACGKGDSAELTMQDIVDANSTASILQQYDSFLVTTTGDGEEFSFYADKEIFFTSESYDDYNLDFMVTRSEKPLEYFKENDLYVTKLYVGEDWEVNFSWADYQILNAEFALAETITGTQPDGDTLIVKAEISAEKLDPELFAGYECIKIEYKLDAETNLIHSMLQTAELSDGTEESVLVEVSCNVSRPAKLEDLYARAFQTANLRTVTIVVAAGTDEEARYSASVPKGGDVIQVHYPDENNILYYDPECTQPVDDENNAINYEADSIYYMPAY